MQLAINKTINFFNNTSVPFKKEPTGFKHFPVKDIYFSGAQKTLPKTFQNKINKCAKRATPAITKPYQWKMKQLIDYVGSACALTAMLPALIASGIAIKLESKGPILLKQTRIGLNGKSFEMYKFRTMIENPGPAPKGFKKGDIDPRITKVGAFLRRTSLDEIPQLLNIFKGDMSFVGPRPYLANDVTQMSKKSMKRYIVKPGIALASFYHKNKSVHPTIEQKIPWESNYIKNWNLSLDFKIIKAYISDMIKGHNN